MTINFYNLVDFVKDFVFKNRKSIIYVGGGTKFNNGMINNEEWKMGENQQLPLFISNAKSKCFDIKVLLILIDPDFDPEYNKEPYIVSENNMYSGSWNVSPYSKNHYISEFGLEVIVISESIYWGYSFIEKTKDYDYNHNDMKEIFDFEIILTELCKIISNNDVNSLLFYHEFTGLNVSHLKNLIKNRIIYDERKICIDITNDSNLSCYVNLSEPINYPVIDFISSDKLVYISPDILTNQEKKQIVENYKKFTIEYFNNKQIFNTNFNRNTIYQEDEFSIDTNYLFDKTNEYILCFQIIQNDYNLLKLIINGIISMIRQLTTDKNNKNFGTKMYVYPSVIELKNKFNIGRFKTIETNFELLDQLNVDTNYYDIDGKISNWTDITEEENIIKEKNKLINDIKTNILSELYDVLEYIGIEILDKYNIEKDVVKEFIKEFKQVSDKYHLIDYFKKFIENISNIQI